MTRKPTNLELKLTATGFTGDDGYCRIGGHDVADWTNKIVIESVVSDIPRVHIEGLLTDGMDVSLPAEVTVTIAVFDERYEVEETQDGDVKRYRCVRREVPA